MNSSDRPEFDKQLGILCAGLDTPCTDERREAYWKGLKSMGLTQFARTVEHMLANESWVRMPKPAQVWESSKRLRAQGPTPLRDDGFRGDDWEAAANRHLLRHITHRLQENPQRYGKPASYLAMRMGKHDLDLLGLNEKQLDASPEFIANVEKLVTAKRQWAEDMRDLARETKQVDKTLQREIWADYIGRVEASL